MKNIKTLSDRVMPSDFFNHEIYFCTNEIENGIQKENSLLVKYFKEEFRSNLVGKTINDFVIVQLDKAFDEKELEFILSDLGLDKNDPVAAQKHFKIQITKIGLLEKKELTEEFYNQLYPGQDVKTESDFRNKIKEEIERMFINDSEKRFKTDVVKALMEKVKITLPDEFLKRWLIATNEKPVTKEQLEQEYPVYAEHMKWQLIENKILKDKQIKVSSDEALAYTKELVLREMLRYGRTDMDDKSLTEMATKILAKEEEAKRIYEQLYDRRLMDVFKTTFTLEEKELPYDEFFKN